MTLDEIKQAVDAGKVVHWKNDGYTVIRVGDNYLISFAYNDYAIGLTWLDGTTLNGKPDQFYLDVTP